MGNCPKKICPQLFVFCYHCIFLFFHGIFVRFPLQVHIHLLQTAGCCIQKSPVFLSAEGSRLRHKHYSRFELPDISILPVRNTVWMRRHAVCFHKSIWPPVVSFCARKILCAFLFSPGKKAFLLIKVPFFHNICRDAAVLTGVSAVYR